MIGLASSNFLDNIRVFMTGITHFFDIARASIFDITTILDTIRVYISCKNFFI